MHPNGKSNSLVCKVNAIAKHATANTVVEALLLDHVHDSLVLGYTNHIQ